MLMNFALFVLLNFWWVGLNVKSIFECDLLVALKMCWIIPLMFIFCVSFIIMFICLVAFLKGGFTYLNPPTKKGIIGGSSLGLSCFSLLGLVWGLLIFGISWCVFGGMDFLILGLVIGLNVGMVVGMGIGTIYGIFVGFTEEIRWK